MMMPNMSLSRTVTNETNDCKLEEPNILLSGKYVRRNRHLKACLSEDGKCQYSNMLTGSLAANFYAVPHMTRDIDFVVELLTLDVNRFFKCFQNDFYTTRKQLLTRLNTKVCLISYTINLYSK